MKDKSHEIFQFWFNHQIADTLVQSCRCPLFRVFIVSPYILVYHPTFKSLEYELSDYTSDIGYGLKSQNQGAFFLAYGLSFWVTLYVLLNIEQL